MRRVLLRPSLQSGSHDASLTAPSLTCPPGEVRMPSGRTARPHITDNKDGTVTVKYSPSERGLHEMDIRYDGDHIPGRSC